MARIVVASAATLVALLYLAVALSDRERAVEWMPAMIALTLLVIGVLSIESVVRLWRRR